MKMLLACCMLVFSCISYAEFSDKERQIFVVGAYNGCILANGMHPSVIQQISVVQVRDFTKRCRGLLHVMPAYTKLTPQQQSTTDKMFDGIDAEAIKQAPK